MRQCWLLSRPGLRLAVLGVAAIAASIAYAQTGSGSIERSDSGEANALVEGPGRDTVARVCSGCHNFAKITRFRKSGEEWVRIVANMKQEADDGEVETILGYLIENYGPDSKINVNRAPAEELRAILDLSLTEAVAVLDYRREHGPFHDLDDFLKTPGLNARKIQMKKDLLAF